jgi:hypothetical protein
MSAPRETAAQVWVNGEPRGVFETWPFPIEMAVTPASRP